MTSLFPRLRGRGMIAVDLETCDPDLKTHGPGYHRDGYIVGIAVGTEDGYRKYYPIAHEGGGNLDRDQVLQWVRAELSGDEAKVGTNLSYDLGFLKAAGINVRGPLYDIMLAEPLLNEDRLSYGLNALAQDYLGETKVDDELDAFLIEHFGKKNPKSNIWRAPAHIVAPYAEGDVDLPLRIFPLQRKKLEDEGLWDLYILESKLIPMLLDMRFRGIKIDLAATEKLYEEMTIRQNALLTQIGGRSVWAARELSPLFDAEGVPYPRTPKTNAPSITALFLERCDHPLAQTILEIRRLDKLRETFLKGVILDKHYKGRLHTSFHQLRSDSAGTVSGRLSSTQPNLQFISGRTDDGKRVREMFIPDDDQDLYSLDYSQIEYRLMVHDAAVLRLDGAAEVVRRYHEDSKVDFHQAVADMTGLSRTAAKTVNFGIAYGEGVAKLCASLGLSEAEGQRLLETYHSRAPFMRPLSRRFSNLAASTGEVVTLLGRKRRFNAWAITNRVGDTKIVHHRVPGSKRAFTHKALNARIQGSAADIMKKAMIDVYESGVMNVLGVPQLTVHDELLGSVPKTQEGKEALEEMRRIMENTVKLTVPLVVDGSTGANWKEAK